MSVYVNLGVFAILCLQLGPAWPLFRRNEPQWLEANFKKTILDTDFETEEADDASNKKDD